MDFDDSWCPVCGRQIIPKRYQVPISPAPAPAPAPPPSSPQSSPTKGHGKKSKAHTRVRVAGGLVQGTGRVKPNGALKPPTTTSTDTPPPKTNNKNPAPLRTRTVIDPAPLPLYCSDECRLVDIQLSSDVIPHDFNPNRESVAVPPVPHNSFAAESPESMSSGSNTSTSSVDSKSSTSKPTTHGQQTHMSPSIATLAAIYNFPPLPPPLPIFDEPSSDEWESPISYDNGVMMAAQKIRAILPGPLKRERYGNYVVPPEPRKPIPGWTDGSNAWRATVYNLTSRDPADIAGRQETSQLYKSHNATPLRSRGVYSTLGTKTSTSAPPSTTPTATRSLEDEELLFKYNTSFVRSRAQFSSSSAPSSAPRRERPLVHPDAEGKLIVPNVKLRVNTGSCSNLSTSGVRSPLSRHGSGSSEGDGAGKGDLAATFGYKRPVIETRSWSYDNVKTYPVMKMPSTIEKRKEKRIIDGVEQEIEVEVEIANPMKKLFLFPDKEVVVRR